MTVLVEAESHQFPGNGTTDQFDFEFQIFDSSELVARLIEDATGSAELLVIDADYTLEVNATGGTITTTDPVASGYTLDVRPVYEILQTTSIRNQGSFRAEVHEQVMDRLTSQLQYLHRLVSRSMHLADYGEDGADLELPTVTARASKFLAFDLDGNPVGSNGTGGGDSALRSDLAITTVSNDGARLLGFRQTATGAVGRTAASALRERLSFDDFGAAGDAVANDAAEAQLAFDAIVAGATEVNLRQGATYACGATGLTCLRVTALGNKRFLIDGHGAQITFATLSASGIGLRIGAYGGASGNDTSYFSEGGHLIVQNLTLVGPETGSTLASNPTTDTTGLFLEFAGSVELRNVKCPGFKTAFRSRWAFPVRTYGCSGRGSWIGWYSDESTNHVRHESFEVPNCRFGFVFKSTTTALDDGKQNSIKIIDPWWEGAHVGAVFDTGTGGPGLSAFRSIEIEGGYTANTTYDTVRLGTVFDFTAPQTRGANCTNFINDFKWTGGLLNPSGGAWGANNACVAFDSATRVKSAFLFLPMIDPDDNANAIVNGPAGGLYITSAYPTVSDGRFNIVLIDSTGAKVLRVKHGGNIMMGSAKTTADAIAQVGIELKPSGVIDQTASGGGVSRKNRTTSDGTVDTFMRQGVTVGSISVTGSATAFNTSSDRRLKNDLGPVEGIEAAITAAPARMVSFKSSPEKPLIAMYAQDIQTIAPWAVSEIPVDEADPEKGTTLVVDYSKLVPLLWAAVADLYGRQ